MTEMIDCEAVMRQLWDYLDGELTRETERAMRDHLAACKRCHPHHAFESAFLRALAVVRRTHSRPEALRREVLGRLRAEGFAA